jgi:hypothetical protein
MRQFKDVKEITIKNEGDIAEVSITYFDGKTAKLGVDFPDLYVISDTIARQMSS